MKHIFLLLLLTCTTNKLNCFPRRLPRPPHLQLVRQNGVYPTSSEADGDTGAPAGNRLPHPDNDDHYGNQIPPQSPQAAYSQAETDTLSR